MRILFLLGPILTFIFHARADAPVFMTTLNGVTEHILSNRQPGSGGIEKYKFASETARSQAYARVTGALPSLFTLDERIMRVERTVANILTANGNDLSPRQLSQVQRLAYFHREYMKVRNAFVGAIRSMATTLNADLAREIRDQKNQFRRASRARSADPRVLNYGNNIDKLNKVPGDHGVRNMLNNLHADPKKGTSYIVSQARIINQNFIRVTSRQQGTRAKAAGAVISNPRVHQ